MSIMTPGPSETKFRTQLAAWIVAGSVAGVAAVSVVVIWLSSPDQRTEMARLVFTSALPLLGTWVGTVLAFYFARDNFETATTSTLRLTGRLERTTPVTDVMTPRPRIIARVLKANEPTSKVMLSELYKQMQTANVRRIPILEQTESVKYIIHLSLLMAYAQSVPAKLDDPAFDKTLDNLLGYGDSKKLAEAIAFVAPSATVGMARDKMQSVPRCNDVFVTTGGEKADPVVGWLTDMDLAVVN